eukprot:531116-Hanusia_phi.AAC.4
MGSKRGRRLGEGQGERVEEEDNDTDGPHIGFVPVRLLPPDLCSLLSAGLMSCLSSPGAMNPGVPQTVCITSDPLRTICASPRSHTLIVLYSGSSCKLLRQGGGGGGRSARQRGGGRSARQRGG